MNRITDKVINIYHHIQRQESILEKILNKTEIF